MPKGMFDAMSMAEIFFISLFFALIFIDRLS